MQRIAIQPARRVGRGNPNPRISNDSMGPIDLTNDNNTGDTIERVVPHGPPAKLYKVRNLYELWQEYEFGMGGNKAAKLFTAEERGRVKHKYTRRKVVWDCIKRQTSRGVHYNVAIDRIYTVYGQNQPVTRIINRMRVDKRNNNMHVSIA